MQCHKILNFNPHDLIGNFDIIPKPLNNITAGVVGFDPKLCLKDYYYNKLLNLGTKLESLVFYMKPNANKRNIHIDIDKNTLKPYWPSLNILIQGQGIMKWFKPITDSKLRFNSNGKVLYKSWENENDYGEILDVWSTGKVALVRTDIPHNAWNPGVEDRLVISIRWKQCLSWDETLEWFEKNFTKEE